MTKVQQNRVLCVLPSPMSMMSEAGRKESLSASSELVGSVPRPIWTGTMIEIPATKEEADPSRMDRDRDVTVTRSDYL